MQVNFSILKEKQNELSNVIHFKNYGVKELRTEMWTLCYKPGALRVCRVVNGMKRVQNVTNIHLITA